MSDDDRNLRERIGDAVDRILDRDDDDPHDAQQDIPDHGINTDEDKGD